MKKIHNIFIKMFLLLALAIGWGSSAWAQTSAFSFTSWDHDTFSQLTEYNTPIFISDTFTTTQEGDLAVRIAYNGGNWAFPAFGVDLVNQSGEVVKTNYAYHKLGTGQNFTYTLTGVPVGTYTLRYWTCSRCEDGSMYQHKTNNPAITAISFTGSTVGATPSRTAISRTELKEACITAKGIPSDLWSIVQTNLSTGAGLLYEDDACTLNAGHYTMKFTYSGGDSSSHNDRLNLRGVELRDGSGNVVSSDCHVGYTGSAQSNTTYSFDVPIAGSYTVRTIVLPEDGTSTCPRSKGNIAYTFEAAVAAVDVDCTFDPAAGSTVETLTTVTVDFEENVYNAYDATAYSLGIIPEGTPQQLPELRRISDNAVVATATGVTSNSVAGMPYNITFAAPIPDGEYTLVIPEGTFYKPSSDWQVWSPVSEMTVDYTVASGAWKVIITGAKRADERITYHNNKRFGTQETSKLASGAESASVGDGEFFIFNDDLREGDLLDCDFTSSAESRTEGTSFVYGPVIDWENHTITCEIREAITAKPTTAGWYQLKWDVSTNNVAANTRHTTGAREDQYTNPTRDANRFYITMPRGGNSERSEYLNYNTYPTDDTTPLTFVKLVPSGGNLMMMTIDGRFVQQNGYPSTSGSGYANPVAYVEGELDFQYWFPFGSNSTYFLGQAGSTHNYFYTAPAKFDDDRYEFYEVKFEADNVPSTAYARYKGSATNYSMTNVYQNGYFVFPKGHIPTVADFDVSGVTFTNMTIDIKGTGNVKTLTFKELNGTLDGEINLKFVDNAGHDLTDAKVKCTLAGGEVIELSSTEPTHEFNGVELGTCKFRSTGDYHLVSYAYDDESKTITFTLGVPEWFFVKSNYDSNANSGYLSSDYKDGSGYYQRNTGTKPTNYAGIWRKESVVGNGYNLINAKYLYSQILTTTGGSEAHYMQLDPVSSLRSGAYYELTDERQSNGETFFKYINESNYYFGISGNYWVRRTKPSDRSSYLTITRAEVMGKSVTVRVQDDSGNAYAPGAIFQTQCEDPAFPRESLTIHDGDVVDFHNMPYLASMFRLDDSRMSLTNIVFDEATQTLTLTVAEEPNKLAFSSAPVNGEWADDTKWFTIRNVNEGYMNTAEAYIDDNRNLKITNTATPGDRGGAWCVVPVGDNSYNIYNAAYGPDFILGVTGSGGSARVQMYPKGNVPSGVNTAFDFPNNGNKPAGTNYAYGMHTAGGYLNRQSGYPALYGSNDNGSSFCFTAIPTATVNSWPEYDVYKVEGYEGVTYFGSRTIFGKRKSDPYIILAALPDGGEEIKQAELSIPAGREIESVEVKPASENPASSYIKILQINLTKYFIADAGWYQMTITPNGSTATYNVVYNTDAEKYADANSYPLSVAANDAARAEYATDNYKRDARQWVYINCNTATGKWTMQALDGHYLNAEMQATKAAASFDYVYQVTPDAADPKHYTGPTEGINVAGGSLYLGSGGSNRHAQFHPVVLTPQQHGAAKHVYEEPAVSPSAQRVAPAGTTDYDIWKVVGITGGYDPATDVSSATRVTCLNKANAGLTKVYKNGYFVFPAGTAVNPTDFTIGAYHTTAESDLPAGADKALAGVSTGGSGNTATFTKDGVTVTVTLNPANKEITVALTVNNSQIPILPRTSYYVDNSTAPEGKHLVTKDDGWMTRDDGKIVQNASEFRVVNYVAPGAKRIAVLPTVMVQLSGMQSTSLNAYQRWYSYDDAGATPIPSGISFYNSGTKYKNGNVYSVSNVFYYTMPATNGDYTIAGDHTRWDDKIEKFIAGDAFAGVNRSDPNPSGIADGTLCYLEPTIGMRTIYEFHDANEIATRLTSLRGKYDPKSPPTVTKEDGTDVWLEGIMRVTMPSVSTTICADVLPLGMAVQNYWIKTGGKLKNTDKAARKGDKGGDAQIVVEIVDPDNTGITPGISSTYVTCNNDAGTVADSDRSDATRDMLSPGLFYDGVSSKNNISITGRPRYVEFEYPTSNLTSDSRRQVNMEGHTQKTAYINVYLKDDAVGDDDPSGYYRIKRFEITFTADTEMRYLSDLMQESNDKLPRNSAYMRGNYEKATELIFDLEREDYKAPSGGATSTYNYTTPIKYNEMSYSYFHNNNTAPNSSNSYNQLRWGEYSLFNALSLRLEDEANNTPYETFYPIAQIIKSQGSDYAKSQYASYRDGYFIYIDAAELPGNIATLKMDGKICTNSIVNVSMYMASGCGYRKYLDQLIQGINNTASIIIRVWGVTSDGDRYNIYNYCPGQVGGYIGKQGIDSNTKGWQQMFFSFQPSTLEFANGHDVKEISYDHFEFELTNNCMSSQGGDFVISDLEVFINKPNARAESVSPLCGHEIDAIKLVTDYDNLLKASAAEEVADVAAATQYHGVYCFLDQDIFNNYLEDHKTDIPEVATRVNNAFNAALVGRTAAGSDVTDPFHVISYWNCFDKHAAYNYEVLANPAHDVLTEAMKNDNDQLRQLVFNARVTDKNSSEEFNQLQAGHTYILTFGVLAGDDLTGYNACADDAARQAFLKSQCTGMFYKLDDVDCAVTSTFEIQPAFRLVIDAEDQGNSSPTHKNFCSGQAPSIQVKNTEYTASGHVQDRAETLYYDWYGASLENYYRQVPSAAEYAAIGLTAEGVDPDNETFKVNPAGPTDRQFSLDEALLIFRSHFPDAVDLDGNKVGMTARYSDLPLTDTNRKRTDPNMPDYTLAMQEYLKQYMQYPDGDLSKTPRLRLYRQQVQLNLTDTPLGEVAALVAIPTDRREGFTRFNSGTLSLNCYEPQEVSFVPNTPAPTTIIGHGELDSHYPSLLSSIPLRMTQSQAEAISRGHKLQIPLRQLNTSGFFDKIIYDDDDPAATPSQHRSGQYRASALSKLLKNAKKDLTKILDKVKGDKKDKNYTVEITPVNFEVDASRSDLVIIETNDPQWQMNLVNEDGDTFLPCVGTLRQINAGTASDRNAADNNVVIQFNTIDLGGSLNGAAVPDADGVTYTFKTDANGRYCYPSKGLTVTGTGDEAKNVTHRAYREFVPREGYYYILRGTFMERQDESASTDEEGEGYIDEHCPGTLIIPIKVVPEYMKWTGAVNSDWNNDRNWARADRSDLVTIAGGDASEEGTDVQNPTDEYRNYIYNEYDYRGRHEEADYVHTEHNGVTKATNDNGQSYVAYAETRENVFTRTGTAPDYKYAVDIITKFYRGTDDASVHFYDTAAEVCCLYNNKTLQREYYDLDGVTITDGIVTQIGSTPVADPTLYRICAPLTVTYSDYKGEMPDDLTWNADRATTGVSVTQYTPREGKSIYLPIDKVTGSLINGVTTYAPMKTTRIIIPAGVTNAPALSVAGKREHVADDPFNVLALDDGLTTPYIEYDMPVRTPDNPNDPEAVYTVEPYYENKVAEVHFEPGAVMYNAQYLNYDRAWVDYELKQGKWYTVASPLQATFAGDWYSPTGADNSGTGGIDDRGQQLTPLFQPINYDVNLNNRFNPAYYQRSWDKGTATMYRMPGDGMMHTDADGNPIDFKYWGQVGYSQNQVNVAQKLNWSRVYNDVTVDYSEAGGFSVRPVVPGAAADATVIMRLPKADTHYLYYAKNDGLQDGMSEDYVHGQMTTPGNANNNGSSQDLVDDRYVGDLTAMTRGADQQYKLMSDKLRNDSQFTIPVNSQNEYYLVSNPFMAPLNMTEFFDKNRGFEQMFWLIDEGTEQVGVRAEDKWVTTTKVPAVAPLQGFFVKRKLSATGTIDVVYTAAMQNKAADPITGPSQRRAKGTTAAPVLRIEAANGQGQSIALCYFSDAADNAVKEGEDAETLLDSNLAGHVSTVFTLAATDKGEAQALQFNALSTEVQYIPLGVIAPTDETETTVRLTGTDALAAAMTGTPHLYDAVEDTFVTVEEGMTFCVTGTTSERYFIVSGLTKPVIDDNDDDNDDYDGRIYDLRGIRVNSVQHGTVTISRSRKEYNK